MRWQGDVFEPEHRDIRLDANFAQGLNDRARFAG